MPLDPSRLPLLLAGPILRRVEADLVCVWIATSKPCDVTVLVFPGADVIAPAQAADDARAQWVSMPQQTLAAGARLHVLAATLDLRVPAATRRSAGILRAHQDFSYDILLTPRDGGPPQNLRSLGLLDPPTPLGYDPNELPTFRTCPEDRQQLVILHGSCRRLFDAPPLADDPAGDGPFPPPGGWPTEAPSLEKPVPDSGPVAFPGNEYPAVPRRDGMLWVDALIDQRGPAPRIASRPHQLFLTGDQIYADDVPAVVLPVLNHVGRVLVGEEEMARDAQGSSFVPVTLENFPPAFRRPTVLRAGGFTTTDGESHLLSFGEFAAYYLLTWSPSLWSSPAWSSDLWPAFNPASWSAPADWKSSLLWKDETKQPPEKSDGYQTLLAAGPPGSTPDAHAEWFFQQKVRWLQSRIWSAPLFDWWMRRFREGLPRVRRALANIPTYMLMDDHEVTDDWYFSRQWRERVLTRPLGVGIVRNGLTSYSLFQGWGNDPRRFAPGSLERELLDQTSAWVATPPASRRANEGRLHQLLGLPFRLGAGQVPTFRPLVEFSYQVEGPCHRVLVVDGRTRRRFPERIAQAGGIDYEGPTGLFGDSAMAAALPERPAGDDKLVLVVTGVPVLGPEGMEMALLPFQRLARLLLDVDAEAWSYEPATFEALLWALSRYRSVVLLSGDIHMGFSAALDYWDAPDGQQPRTARIVQLVSSGFTQTWGGKTPVLLANALTHDVLEQVTTPEHPAERIGWGTPVRTALTPPVSLDKPVKVPDGKVAHPSYRERLRMRAPVVPAEGWPAGTVENRTPNWAWRMWMLRDARPESTAPPTIERRWTPVDMAADPLDPAALGWHARAVRRMAYSRAFAFERNVGVVTFEKAGEEWSVRHVIAGELQPLADTGATPVGLQPYMVHRLPLAPPPASSWTTDRPRLRANGAWGTGGGDPSLRFLVHWLPRIFQWAARFTDPLWPDLPLNLDEAARSGLITEGANKLAGNFRRRILRELGPFAAKSDAELDALTGADLQALADSIGPFDVAKDARALVRPDVERLLNLYAPAADPSAFLDDALRLGCSEWVNERSRLISMISGLLATFRSPVTRHVPVLGGLLEGLWDRWVRQATAEEAASTDWFSGLLLIPSRGALFTASLLREIAQFVIEDHAYRYGARGGPPIFPPELFLAALGSTSSLKMPRRFTTASGWQTDAPLPSAGTRRGSWTAPPAEPAQVAARRRLTLSRQSLSLLVHPGESARYRSGAQRFTVTLIPPETETVAGSLFAGWDGSPLRIEGDIGGGVRQRVEATAGGWLQLPWQWPPLPAALGVPGIKLTMTFTRPVKWSPGAGVELRLTPSLSFSLGLAAGPRPTFEVRLGLNDLEDRVRFLPKMDGFLSSILPTDGITLPFDASIAWDLQNGWRFGGLGEVARGGMKEPETAPAVRAKEVSVTAPVKKKLGILTLDDRSFDLGFDGAGDGLTVKAALGGTVSLNLGPVRLSISGLAVAAELHVASDPLHGGDPLDLSVRPAMPKGAALSIDSRAISGGGFLERVEQGGAVTWRGGLRLRIAEKVDVAGWGIVQSGGGQHWSLLVFLTGRLPRPVQLPWGLRLTAVGGMLALHRRMDADALRDAAFGLSGNLDALLFPDRPEQRFPELLSSAARFFPPAAGHHVFGPMVELEWGAPERKTGRLRAALLLEIGDFKAALYGVAELGFPTLSENKIARIRAGVEALYDGVRQLARFSLVLTDAKLFESVSLTGGAAIFIKWGNDPEFAFTLGGFHPKFRPFIPEGLREPPRLGASWKPVSLLELDLQAYFAFTSTSVQFGASAYARAGASWGGMKGNVSFDLIWMTHPKGYFEAELSARVTVYLFGADLISAGLRAFISGNKPWHFEGTVSWEVCGVDISKDLGPYEWGQRTPTVTGTDQAQAILRQALIDPASWSMRRARRLPVRLRAGSEGALDPRDVLEVRQNRLPLGTPLEVHEQNRLSDPGTWTLEPRGGTAKLADLRDAFPRRRFMKKPPREAPFAGGLVCGARFGRTDWEAPVALAVGEDTGDTEDVVLDSLPAPPQRARVPVAVQLADAVSVSVPTLAVERRWTRHVLALEARR